MTRPSLTTGLRLWHDYENRILKLFLQALSILQKGDLRDMTEEDCISMEFCRCLKKANYELRAIGQGFEVVPVFNAPVQPSLRDTNLSLAKCKKPDFQHSFTDDTAPIDQAYIDYHVECKRLGSLHSAGSDFNRKYVAEGIRRFIDPGHSYGKYACSGAMIGYLQSTEPSAVLTAVNSCTAKEGIPALTLSSNGWMLGGVTQLDNRLDRPFEISPFKLHHLWVDIRKHYEP